jgi:hypothetical protein
MRVTTLGSMTGGLRGSQTVRDALGAGVKHKFTRPYRPQANLNLAGSEVMNDRIGLGQVTAHRLHDDGAQGVRGNEPEPAN